MTQTDIRRAVITGALRKLGTLGADDTPAGADYILADTTLDRLIDALRAGGDATFHKLAIPEDAQQPLLVMLAAALADDFGVADARAARLQALSDQERRGLRVRQTAPASDTVAFTDY